MPNEVEGLSQDWINAFFKSLLGTAKIDLKKLDHAQLKVCIKAAGEAFKPAITLPMDLDDRAIDGLVVLVDSFIDSIPAPTGPLVVGATPHSFAAPAPFLMADAMALAIPQECKDKIAAHPEVLKSLERLSPKNRLKIAANPHWLDLLIQYGPMIINFLLTILPFIL